MLSASCRWFWGYWSSDGAVALPRALCRCTKGELDIGRPFLRFTTPGFREPSLLWPPVLSRGDVGGHRKFCLLFASRVLSSKRCWAFPLFLSSPAHAGDVFRGGHSQEVLFHYPRCCAFWAERGCSPHWDVPGPPPVPELKGPVFANTTNSRFLLQVCGGGSFFFIIISVHSRTAFIFSIKKKKKALTV